MESGLAFLQNLQSSSTSGRTEPRLLTGLDLDPATSDHSRIAGRSDVDLLAQDPLRSNVQSRIPNEEQRGLELTNFVLREIFVDQMWSCRAGGQRPQRPLIIIPDPFHNPLDHLQQNGSSSPSICFDEPRTLVVSLNGDRHGVFTSVN